MGLASTPRDPRPVYLDPTGPYDAPLLMVAGQAGCGKTFPSNPTTALDAPEEQ